MSKYMLIECAEHTDDDIVTWNCNTLEEAQELLYTRFCAVVGEDTIEQIKCSLGVESFRNIYFGNVLWRNGIMCGFDAMSAWANYASGFTNHPDVVWKIVDIPDTKRPPRMYVYLVTEETQQTDFVDGHGETAAPTCAVIGVYGTNEEALRNKEHFEEEDARIQSECDTDAHEYKIVKMAVEPDGMFLAKDYRQKFIHDFGELFTAPEVRQYYEGHGVKSMSLNGKYVHIEFVDGGSKDINVAGDSLSAMCVDIIIHGLW